MRYIRLGNKNKVYNFIRELIVKEECAWFVNQEGRFHINWVAAVERYIEYRAKKNPRFDISIDRSRASNSFREALLLRCYQDDGAKEYKECRKFSENNKVVEREFQLPSKVFLSLFGSSEELAGDQVIWSRLLVNFHVLSIFRTLFWNLTPWCSIHNVNPPHTLFSPPSILNFLVKIVYSPFNDYLSAYKHFQRAAIKNLYKLCC